MPALKPSDLRNVALLSHSGAGKTSLCESLLFNLKETTRIGRVEDGNTVSDYEAEEIKRAASIQSTLIACAGTDYKVNFLDTPGYDDFIGEVVASLKVVESGAIVIPAQSGIDVGTERSWDLCKVQGIPSIFLIHKMDRENANFENTVSTFTPHTQRRRTVRPIPLVCTCVARRGSL